MAARQDVRKTISLEDIQTLSLSDIVRCKTMLGHGAEYGVWETPASLIGRRLKGCVSVFCFRKRIRDALPEDVQKTEELEDLLDEGVLWLSRYALLLSVGPAALISRKNGQSRGLDPTTIVAILYTNMPRILACGILRRLAIGSTAKQGFAHHLDAQNLSSLRQDRFLRDELGRLAMLKIKGLWDDAPGGEAIARVTNPRGKAQKPSAEDKSDPYMPIPDEYMAEMGGRVLWFVLNVGPHLLALAEALPELFSGINLKSSAFPNRLRRYLSENVWCDLDSCPIKKMPFEFMVGSLKKSPGTTHDWPPRTWQQVKNCLTALQSAHLWIALLATAGRMQEVLTLQRNCIDRDRNGRPHLSGKTFKLSRDPSGESRQWPLPAVLVEALAQQVRLARACDEIAWLREWNSGGGELKVEGNNLWASFGAGNYTGGERDLAEVSYALQSLAVRLGMTPMPGGKNLHAHRFRKTIARLAALAIVDSPRVLMQLFGHRDIAMTLHYILGDKTLQVEIEQVTRELRIMRCQEVVESLHSALHDPDELAFGGYGGGAVAHMAEAVISHEETLICQGRQWGADSAYDLAVILTLNGQYFRMVKPGVLCTKPTTELSPCKCGSDCINRIEEKTARRDVMHIIPVLLEQGERALADNQLMVVANVVDQLEDELARFEDIGKEWKENPKLICLQEALSDK
jgi:integrase